jgi:hypothetical protein
MDKGRPAPMNAMDNTVSPNAEQIKSAIRWAAATFGGAIAGFVAGKGWATSDQVIAVVTSDEFIQGAGAMISLVFGIWGWFVHRQRNAVKVASEVPHVAGVITADTPEGKELAAAIPGPAVVVAGTAAAKAVASNK